MASNKEYPDQENDDIENLLFAVGPFVLAPVSGSLPSCAKKNANWIMAGTVLATGAVRKARRLKKNVRHGWILEKGSQSVDWVKWAYNEIVAPPDFGERGR